MHTNTCTTCSLLNLLLAPVSKVNRPRQWANLPDRLGKRSVYREQLNGDGMVGGAARDYTDTVMNVTDWHLFRACSFQNKRLPRP